MGKNSDELIVQNMTKLKILLINYFQPVTSGQTSLEKLNRLTRELLGVFLFAISPSEIVESRTLCSIGG
jgi:hypothetical protein